jgi:peptidoglycan/LPS O-acetylase OafA/YrhL
MKEPFKRVDFLDHLRGIAVLAVFFYHCIGFTFGYTDLPWSGCLRTLVVNKHVVPDSFLLLLPATWGWAGVSIFFVVSGFCIHASFFQQGRQLGNFFIRRFFRLYPTYLACIAFCVVLNAYAIMPYAGGSRQWLTHLLLIHNYSWQTYGGINPVLWSIAVEVQLYLIYPLLVYFVSKSGWKTAMFITAGFEISIRTAQGLFIVISPGQSPFSGLLDVFSVSPFGYWFSWSIGAYIADAYLNDRELPFRKISPLLWLTLALTASLVRPLQSFSFLLFSLATAATITMILKGNFAKWNLPQLPLRGLRQVGIWSYSIYLMHLPLLLIFMRCILTYLPDPYGSPILLFGLCSAVGVPIILISGFWYKLFELPGIAWGKRIIQLRNNRQPILLESPQA